MKYRKKPIVIEARPFFNNFDLIEWINDGQAVLGRDFATRHNNVIVIPTLEGDMIASPGDWIIRGVKGEHYPCKPDVFAATYEPVTTKRIKFSVRCNTCKSNIEVSLYYDFHGGHSGGGVRLFLKCRTCNAQEAMDTR